MKPSRTAAAVAAAALAAVGLAACSDDEPDDGRTHITVTIDAGLEQAAIDAFNARIDQFEEAHPDIAVETQEYTWTAGTFTAQLAGGTLPDVFVVPFTDGRGLIERGQIADIGDLTAELPYRDQYNPNIAAAGEDAEGDLWAVPIAAYGQGLHYNRTLFEAAGLDPDAPPTTWDEIQAAAKTITEETGEAGYAVMTNDNTGGWILTTVVNALGGRTEADGKATIDTPAMREALTRLQAMRWDDQSMGDDFLYDWATINQAFASGRIGMYVSGGGNYGNLFTQNALNPDDYGLTVLPLAEGPDSGVLGGGTLAAVSPSAEADEQAAAVEWIDFYYMEKLTDQAAAVADAEVKAETDQPVGAPELPVFDKATYDEQQSWIAEFVNVPVDQMAPYTSQVFDQPLLTEPVHATQEVYAVLDTVVQTILTEEGADIDALLAQAQTDAQAAIDAAA
ncbi:ABC transporter substrate-binding protein [Glycomyces algeriensis]|uniref:Sugar ABC transporter substrate-binding protein n=1 Tax=Glycomyces algeriensis TaxID=256037 RepID=A0A9W6LHC3_9ACTN|nr:sugar ABC transporter substrate-binding protein [Glycomyces algeriensis]MDA1364732.1 sugar ABC transporter substrate-binding protein [Glycomyces algeriensis]MDR7350773.1 ABC-type glycerol-3-phosphate transport system substrate-binding protein [Glycomyces algeriensis]GLI43483.1 sugar ABC transporter substrate-binding protein [Glycomyces algeriensis]